MIITKKALSRRTVLRGLGASIALPLLDGMVPAYAALRTTAARPTARFGIVYVPMGAVMENWTPATEGPGFTPSPILAPLAPMRDRLVVISGLDNQPAVALPGEPAGGHGRIGAAFLSGVHAKPTEGVDFRAGTSIDQIAGTELGRETQLRTLELGLESTDLAGACDVGYSCAYVNTLCWRDPTTPLPMENNPRAVFERLFGDSDSTDPAAMAARRRRDRSLLDSVQDGILHQRQDLGTRDRARLDEYLEAIRDVERRIQIAEAQTDRELPVFKRPAGGIPERFENYARLMIDLQVLAFEADLTRVITFMIGKELSSRTFPELGVPDQHHPLSHHQNNPEKLEKLTRVQTFQAGLLAYYLDRLAATPDGDGTLLDQITLLYGSGMSNSNLHVPLGLPILVAGGGSGTLRGGRHIRYPEATPLANLYQTLLGKLGVPVERIGNSTGAFHELYEV